MVQLTLTLAKTSWGNTSFGVNQVETMTIPISDQYLELKLVKDSDNWILSDNGHLHKLLEEKYFAVDEGRYTRTAYFTGLKNQNFNLSKKVDYSSLEKGMDGFKTFVTNITKRIAE